MLFKIKDKLNQDSLLIIYNAVIQPYLFNCCEVWDSSFDKYIVMDLGLTIIYFFIKLCPEMSHNWVNH